MTITCEFKKKKDLNIHIKSQTELLLFPYWFSDLLKRHLNWEQTQFVFSGSAPSLECSRVIFEDRLGDSLLGWISAINSLTDGLSTYFDILVFE